MHLLKVDDPYRSMSQAFNSGTFVDDRARGRCAGVPGGGWLGAQLNLAVAVKDLLYLQPPGSSYRRCEGPCRNEYCLSVFCFCPCCNFPFALALAVSCLPYLEQNVTVLTLASFVV